MRFQIGQEVAGYIVQERVRDSNIGTVYRVQHRTLGSQHLLKCVRNSLLEDPQKKEQYIERMLKISALRHPCLIRVTDVVSSDKQCGSVMDLVDGQNITQTLSEKNNITQIGQWICQAICGLVFLHEKDILHLRIHPKNIIIEQERDGTLEGRILDGGYPDFIPEPDTFYFYKAPECWGEAPQPSEQSDIFSLGVILYELLCDVRPFKGSRPKEILNTMLSGEYVKARKRNSKISKALDSVINKALSAFVGDRYKTSKDFFDALQAALGKKAKVDFDEFFNDAEEISPAKCQDISEATVEPEKEPEDDPDVYVEEIPDGISFSHPYPDNVIELDREGRPVPDYEFYVEDPPEKTPPIWHRFSALQSMVILAVFIALMVVYLFPRERDVVLIISDKPSWGQILLSIDGRSVNIGNGILPDISMGSHTLKWTGGILDGSKCERCCWESEGQFQVNFGIGELPLPLTLFPKKRPHCPTDEAGYTFSTIPSGEFMMGSGLKDSGRDLDEIQHRVSFSRPLSVGQTEVTQALYEKVTGRNPSQSKNLSYPVETLSWDDAVLFCNTLSQMEGLTPCYDLSSRYVFMAPSMHCEGYRLPTEAEWEYAATAGQNTLYSGSDTIEAVGWVFTNANNEPHIVKEKAGNLYQLYDMSGNIQEWVWNNYVPYSPSENLDPTGPDDGVYRVLRGGGYTHNSRRARVRDRDKAPPRLRTPYIGFRIVRSLKEQ